MRGDGVLLARRQSGGGAVYHDLGNTNYSFLCAKEEYKQDDGFEIVLGALATLGIRAVRTERNDLVCDGLKFSGSAFRHRRGRSFHHGTLLLNANLDKLTSYLRAPVRRIATKGTPSVRSRVVNLHEVSREATHESVCTAIARRFYEYFGKSASAAEGGQSARPRRWDGGGEQVVQSLEWKPSSAESGIAEERFIRLFGEEELNASVFEAAHRLRSWEWLFGKSPDFEHVLSPPFPATTSLRMHIHRGLIRKVEYDDERTASPELKSALQCLIGCRYDAQTLCGRLAPCAPRQLATELCKMLEEEIP
jgi:hypothetical protein